MAKPRPIKKLTVPIASLRSMPEDHRYAILLLGLFLNEANWLRKLLVKAVLGIAEGPEPDGQANFGLTALLATTLVGKIHEGWDKIAYSRLAKILDALGLPPHLGTLRQEIEIALKGKMFLRIRNNIAFHYPERKFDFQKLSAHLDDTDTVIYMAPEGYQGDVFSQAATLAGIEPLVALSADQDYRVALQAVWEEITHIAGLYCIFVSEAMASVLLKAVPHMTYEDITIPDAPEADENPLRFFVHPPSDLEETRASMNAESAPADVG
jgi:hypothetical protein